MFQLLHTTQVAKRGFWGSGRGIPRHWSSLRGSVLFVTE